MNIVGKLAKWLGVGIYAVCAVVLIMFLTPIGGWKALDVLTGSMKPAIQPGDLVLIHRVALRDIHPGDIVTYTNPTNSKQTITHRVVSKPVKDGLPMVVTKGDANQATDAPFAGGRIVGRVGLIVPFLGNLLKLLHNPLGALAFVLIPGLVVIWAEVGNIRRILAQPKSSPLVWTESKLRATTPEETKPDPEPRRHSRRIDGMGPRTLAIVLAVLMISGGSTLALTTTNKVTAIGKVIVTFNLPTTPAECKNGGWQNFKYPDGTPVFKNQGQCIAFVQSNSHSHIHTIIDIRNIVNQIAITGDQGGNAANTSTITTDVTVTPQMLE